MHFKCKWSLFTIDEIHYIGKLTNATNTGLSETKLDITVSNSELGCELRHQCGQPRSQSNFKKIALAPHDFAGNFYLI